MPAGGCWGRQTLVPPDLRHRYRIDTFKVTCKGKCTEAEERSDDFYAARFQEALAGCRNIVYNFQYSDGGECEWSAPISSTSLYWTGINGKSPG
jgi:hypothetical protein